MNNKDLALISDAAKFLSLDMIDRAESGHPGIVLSAAEVMTTLFCRHLKIDSSNPQWTNRDRFILSAGHGSSILYSLMHLRGFDFTINDLKNFRQLSSNTPGHPERNEKLGVDCSTGPLGQGVGMALGMAIGGYHLDKTYNQKDLSIFDSKIYVLCGDGDLQEGIALETFSLLGTLGLNNVIFLYDSNEIQLDGRVDIVNTENVKMKFESMNFFYQEVKDGHDFDSIDEAIVKAKAEANRPSIIEFRTKIGYKTDLEGTEKCHGSPLGKERTEKLKTLLEWNHPPFTVPEKAYKLMDRVNNYFHEEFLTHDKKRKKFETKYPDIYKELAFVFGEKKQYDFSEFAPFPTGFSDATRNVAGQILDKLAMHNAEFIGGSADVSSSTKVKGAQGIFSKENAQGRHLMFGVREHAMAAAINGLNLFANFQSYCGSFFAFANYMIPAIRMSALMNLPVSYIFSHDSLYVGEDGPTHHPVGHLVQLRSIPGLNVMRPASANETLICMKIAFNSSFPSAVCLTRQNIVEHGLYDPEGVSKGAYIYAKEEGPLDGIVVATGNEVNLALKVKDALAKKKIFIRVVSMPSDYLFDLQNEKYQKSILPESCSKTIFLEMGSVYAGYKYCQHVYGLNRFGKSGKMQDVAAFYKFTEEDFMEYYLGLK